MAAVVRDPGGAALPQDGGGTEIQEVCDEMRAALLKARYDRPTTTGRHANDRTLDELVHEYWQSRGHDYHRLIEACVCGARKARKEWGSIFGPTAIARAIKRGTRQTVSKTATYQEWLQPPQDNDNPRFPDRYELVYGDATDHIFQRMRADGDGE